MGMYMTSFLKKMFVGSLLFITAMVFAQERPLYWSEFFSSSRQHARASVRHIERGGIGYNHGYTTFETFLAPDPNTVSVMPFLDVRGHLFDNGNGAANVGVGLRSLFCNRVYGANVYYDYRNTQRRNYNQVGFGFETLGKRWDFRANGYVPVGRKISCPFNTQFVGFSGHNLILKQQYQFAMAGVNAEVGVYFGRNRFVDFYAAVGPYFFTGTECVKPHVWGGKARLVCRLKEYATLEFSDSYDNMFRNRFQFSFTLTMPFGSGADPRASEDYEAYGNADVLPSRMTLPVVRQEIIVVGCGKKCAPAINPATGLPYNFVFVDNTSHSEGTFRSPYPTLALAQENSGPNDIIYVFPGNGTTEGMNQGITLQLDQKFWGSGVAHPLLTAQGPVIIPPLSTSAPIMTSAAEGDGITLAARNEVSGFTITDAYNNGIVGTNIENVAISDCTINNSQLVDQIHLEPSGSSAIIDLKNLTLTNSGGDAIRLDSTAGSTLCTIDNCTFKNTGVYCINSSTNQSNIRVTNNTISNNTNGSTFTFGGPTTFEFSNNTINNTTSTSDIPLSIIAGSSAVSVAVENNTITDNETGALRFTLNNTSAAELTVKNNIITNNTTGSIGTLGSPILINPNGTSAGNCYLNVRNNMLSGNGGSGCVYCYNGGGFNNLEVDVVHNIITQNNGGGLIFTNSCNTFTLNAASNTITNNGDQALSTQTGPITTADITIANNQITGNTGGSNGCSINHAGSTLNFAITNNNLSNNEGSGILMYPGTAITNVTANIANNTISDNQNTGSNASGGIDLEQFTNFTGTITNNALSNNLTPGLYIASTEPSPTACITMSGNNNNTGYTIDSGTGTFNLAPCNVDDVNVGTITKIGTINPVESCPAAVACPA